MLLHRSLTALGVVAAMLAPLPSPAAYAGPIDPPPGPVAPTYKTLDEVEPRKAVSAANTPGSAFSEFVISQPGSYYLTGNITVGPGKQGIAITTPRVTLDLNGYSVVGSAESLDGIHISLGAQRVTVRNGVIRGCGGDGLEAEELVTETGTIEDLSVLFCGGSGIIAGLNSTVRRCSVLSNVGDGIVARPGSHVSECTASSNSADGFDLAGVCTITGCTALLNSGWGIRSADTVRIERCHLSGNGGGIQVGSFSAVRNNTVDFHLGTLPAIRLTGHQNTVDGNAVTRAAVGVDVDGSANTVLRNAFSGTATPGDIANGNAYGPFVNISGAGDIAAVPGSGHPWANFVQ